MGWSVKMLDHQNAHQAVTHPCNFTHMSLVALSHDSSSEHSTSSDDFEDNLSGKLKHDQPAHYNK